MTLKQLIDIHKEVAIKKPNINYVDEGNVYTINSKPDMKYSAFIITQDKVEVYENYKVISLILFYIDRGTDNMDNRLQIQSDAIRELTNIINTVIEVADIEVNTPYSFKTFNERFSDIAYGAFATVQYVVEGEGLCFFE